MPCHSIQQGIGWNAAELPICKRTALGLCMSVDIAGSIISDESVLPSVTVRQRPVSISLKTIKDKDLGVYFQQIPLLHFCKEYFSTCLLL